MRTPVLVFVLLLVASAASAQQPGPIPIAAVDVRGFYPALGQDPTTAANLGINPLELPKRALGGVVGLNLYPIRTRRFAFGVMGEGLLARGRSQQDPPPTAPGAPPPPEEPPVEQRIRGLSAGVTLNFGTAKGWSYLTAGMGPMSFVSFIGEAPVEPPPTKMTLNMGGGARWFITSHVAFEFDVRFYLTRPMEVVGPYPGRDRNRLLVMSAGVGFK